MNYKGKIRSGGVTLIGQQQDYAGFSKPRKSFIGDVTELNVWGQRMYPHEIVSQFDSCQIPKGSKIWWSQFKDGVHGEVVVEEP